MRISFLLLGSLLLFTCYNPQIISGGLQCSAALECPGGMTCSQATTVCYKNGEIPTAGSGGVGTAAGGSPTGGTGGTSGVGGAGGTCAMPAAPYGPFANCTPALTAGACDPVCQSGCGCTQRCKLEGGNNVCRDEGPNFLNEYAACEPPRRSLSSGHHLPAGVE